MNYAFANKVAIVTGATSGIGRDTAIAFAREGAKVVVAGRRESEGGAVVEEIKKAGGEAIFVRTDVSLETDAKNLVDQAVSSFGRLDFAFNNAGIFADTGPITTATDELFEKTFGINVRGVMNCMKYQIPAMLQTGGGSIVNNASSLGLSVIPGAAVYNASKFAVIGLTKTAALEFSAQGVRVNAVCPAVVETDINASARGDSASHDFLLSKHPIGRFGKVEEISAAVLFLCSPGASFTTGIALPLDGGFTAA
jgi:NAD(P)-dependent dehydrogenase (short-subunit alcohol dehydrogenase family)